MEGHSTTNTISSPTVSQSIRGSYRLRWPTRVWTVKRLVERDGDVVLVEWEGFVDPGSYTWESVPNFQNDLSIGVLTDFPDALPQVKVVV